MGAGRGDAVQGRGAGRPVVGAVRDPQRRAGGGWIDASAVVAHAAAAAEESAGAETSAVADDAPAVAEVSDEYDVAAGRLHLDATRVRALCDLPVVPPPMKEFVNLWRTRQCEYAWLRSMTNRYVNFSR